MWQKKATHLFYDSIQSASLLFIGDEYLPHRLGIKGSPFLGDIFMTPTELQYNGVLYKEVPMLYDLVRQKLVVNRYNDNARMSLISDKVKSFITQAHHFERLSFIATDGTDKNGFFDILLSGSNRLLSERIKRVEITMNTEVPPTFIERDLFYISNAGGYFPVVDRKSLLAAFAANKEEVKMFVRKKKFKLKKEIEHELLAVVTYYESLLK